LDEVQQRLSDRIVIERAKGVLLQRLGISEEEAYKRLRVLSRRQRRPIRDIAQSLLDTQDLLVPPPDLTDPDPGAGRPDCAQSLPPA
jgi:AmiR/NasT family two-component response regulator